MRSIPISSFFIAVLIIVGLLCFDSCKPAAAAPFKGYIGVETPAGVTDRHQDDSTALVGRLELPNCIAGRATLWGTIHQNLKDGWPWNKENKLCVGADIPLLENITLYSFFERRYSTGDNRVVIGARYNFHGTY